MSSQEKDKELIPLVGRIYDTRLGWRPSQGHLKPVHVAHNVASALAPGSMFDTTALLKFVSASSPKRGIIPEHGFDVLRESYGDALGVLTEDREYFTQVRRALKQLIDADGAAFAEKSNFAPTLTSLRMTGGPGRFGGMETFLLSFMGVESALGGVARAALLDDEGPVDPVTALAYPMLAREPGQARHTPTGRDDRMQAMQGYPGFLEAARQAGDCLARNEPGIDGRMYDRISRLQRVVRFSCLMIYRHVQEAAATVSGRQRTPMLIDYSYWRRNNIAAASNASFQRLAQGMVGWIEAEMESVIRSSGTLPDLSVQTSWMQLSREDMTAAIWDLERAEEGTPDLLRGVTSERARAREDVLHSVALARPDAEVPTVLAKTFTQRYMEASDSSPTTVMRFLGERLGLLYPASGQKKRFRPAPALLDIMVRGCVEPGEYLAYREFLQRLWERFGFVAGPDQAGALQAAGLDVSAQALTENQNMLLDALVEIGLAKRLPDHEAIVGIEND